MCQFGVALKRGERFEKDSQTIIINNEQQADLG